MSRNRYHIDRDQVSLPAENVHRDTDGVHPIEPVMITAININSRSRVIDSNTPEKEYQKAAKKENIFQAQNG
jgi:hypothetical protein